MVNIKPDPVPMERRMRWKSHVRCGAGEKIEITSKSYLSLSPLFAVGGLYDISNPFFLGRIKLEASQKGYSVSSNTIKEVVNSTFLGKNLSDYTSIGIANGVFNNKEELEEILPGKVDSIDKFFNNLIDEVKEYYGE